MPSTLWRQTGGIWPIGVSCSLTWYDLGAIAYILQVARVKTVIEIGVEHGGLAAYLVQHGQYSGFDYVGIDITQNLLDARVHERINFKERDAWAKETIAEVGAWVASTPGSCLIICDGGDKPKELKLYAPLLRHGDILLGHDYHNEYTDEALEDMPPMVEQVRTDWLDDTLLCMFVRRP